MIKKFCDVASDKTTLDRVSCDSKIQYSARQIIATVLFFFSTQLPMTTYHEWISVLMIVRRVTGS